MNLSSYTRGFLLITVAALGYALYRMLSPLAGPIAWAVTLAFLLAPLQRALSQRLGGRAGAAAGLITALTPVVLLLPLTSLGVMFVRQVNALVERLRTLPPLLSGSPLQQLETLPLVGPGARWLRENLSIGSDELMASASNAVQGALKGLASAGSGVVLGAVGTVFGFFVMLFILFFLLRDGRQMRAAAIRLVPIEAGRRDEILALVANTTRAVVYGTGLTALAQGALVGLGFAMAQLPSPIVFGVLAAICALLPAGGAAIVWVPGALWLLATGEWGWGVFMLVWGALVSVSDNLIRPIAIRSHAEVSTLAVFVGVVGGVAAFGTIGVILGPVLLTLVVSLLGYVDATQVPEAAAQASEAPAPATVVVTTSRTGDVGAEPPPGTR
ncbi:MAG: AI-2E family transporter [Steroidobacteraceae bacterium]|jgi:predicted PurR-regulated permease PerM|nr:AI-2E family transporter [Steroidobacteraceae bacterium]